MRFHLGNTRKGRVTVSSEELATHMQVIGATGSGKSYFLRYLAQQIITASDSPGLIVIDPHGSLYRQLLRFAVYLGLKDRVVLFDPSESPFIVGYNPMGRDARVIPYQAMMALEACRKVWGQETFKQTPRLARWLYNAFYGTIEAGLTLQEARYMLEPLNPLYRQVITPKISNEIVRHDWEWMLEQKPRLIEERTESALNRLRPFLDNHYISNILTQQRTVLKLREIMEEGEILLVNLESHSGGLIAPEHAHLLGTLLVNDILAAAFARPEGRRRPVYLIIDEFQNFVTKDICAILDGGRKYGLHLILAHQHAIGQIKERDPEVYYSVLTNARLKVIFGGLAYEDAEVLAKEVFHFDPEKIKLKLYRTFYEPRESSREIITTSEGQVTNTILSSSLASGEVYGTGGGFFDPELGISLGLPLGFGPELVSTSEVEIKGSAHGEGEHRSIAHTVVPFYEYHERKELSSVQFESLENQLYQAIEQLRSQPAQYAAVKIPDRKVKFIKVPTLKEVHIRPGNLSKFKERIFTGTGYYSTIEEVQKERLERAKALQLPSGEEEIVIE